MTLTTTFDAVDTIFATLRDAGIAISGNIYKFNKPINSEKEDIVIIPLPLTADKVQKGIINVNIYVPDLQLGGDNTQPNISRFRAISGAVLVALNEVWGNGYNFSIETSGELIPSNIGWFNNIRVEYNSVRL